MKKFKWYWLIPIIGLVFFNQMNEWVFDGSTFEKRIRRNDVSMLVIVCHILCIGLLMAIIKLI